MGAAGSDSFPGESAIHLLREEYLKRLHKNPLFSIRAYARYIGVSAGALSEILNGKRTLTPLVGEKIAARLSLSENKRRIFFQSISRSRTHKDGSKKLSLKRSPFKKIRNDLFHLVAEYEHFALLSLLVTRPYRIGEKRTMARRLKLSSVEVATALERLETLELIKREKGYYRVTYKNVCSPNGIPNESLRRAHRKMLKQAMESLDQVPIEERDFSSITMAIDPSKLPHAKQLIKNFRRRLSKYLESGDKKEVYRLSIQLIPLTRKEN